MKLTRFPPPRAQYLVESGVLIVPRSLAVDLCASLGRGEYAPNPLYVKQINTLALNAGEALTQLSSFLTFDLEDVVKEVLGNIAHRLVE